MADVQILDLRKVISDAKKYAEIKEKRAKRFMAYYYAHHEEMKTKQREYAMKHYVPIKKTHPAPPSVEDETTASGV